MYVKAFDWQSHEPHSLSIDQLTILKVFNSNDQMIYGVGTFRSHNDFE